MNTKKIALIIGILVLVGIIVLRLLPGAEAQTVLYNCGDGVEVLAEVTDRSVEMVVPGGEEYSLKRVSSSQGYKYESGDGETVFWSTGGEAVIEVQGVVLSSSCQPQSVDDQPLSTESWQQYASGVLPAGIGIVFSHPAEAEITVEGNNLNLDFKNNDQDIAVKFEVLEVPANLEALKDVAEGQVVDQFVISGNDAYNYVPSSATDNRVVVVAASAINSLQITYSASLNVINQQIVAKIVESLNFYNEDISLIEDVPTVGSVKIALLEPSSANPTHGCDNVVLIERPVLPTTTPLNQALRQLFLIDSTEVDGYQHFIPNTADTLQFDRATIINNRADIYLLGQLSGLAGVCDNPRAENQIIETAKQFVEVESVQLYLNGIPVEHLYDAAGARG